ncbi:hypothetical protein ACYSN5_07820 [Bacillus spizizenii]
MKKFAILMFSMLLLLSACGTAENSTGTDTNAEAESETVETVTKEGTFAGLADSHTIAVTIDGEETSIQVEDTELQDKVNSISEGQKLSVTYAKESNGVLQLKKLETK